MTVENEQRLNTQPCLPEISVTQGPKRSLFAVKQMQPRLKVLVWISTLWISGCYQIDPYKQNKVSERYLSPDSASSASIKEAGLLAVETIVNGQKRNLFVDTGSGITDLDQRFADQLGLVGSRNTSPALTPHGGIVLRNSEVDSITVSNLSLKNFRLNIFPSPVPEGALLPADYMARSGAIGGDILVRFHGVIDLQLMKLEFIEDVSKPVPANEERVAGLFKTPHVKHGVAIKVVVDGVERAFMVDTGANSLGSVYTNSELSVSLAKEIGPPVKVYAGNTFREKKEFFRAKTVTIGSISCDNVVFDLDENPPLSRVVSEHPDLLEGRLGLSFFLENRLIIDLARMEVRRRIPNVEAQSTQL